MKNVKVSFKILFILFCSLSLGRDGFAKAEVKDAVVKIYTVFNCYNYHEPWQKWGQKSFHGSGCIIKGNRILTNAHVVSDQTFIQVRRAGKAKKYTATVEIIAHECDLAILKVDDTSFFTGVKPVKIGGLANFRDKVAVYGFPEGGDKLCITEGVVSRVEHSKYTHSNAYLLACQIDAPINSGNSGGPVIKDNRIIGVAFQGMYGEDIENIGYMVPVPVINHFLTDIEDGSYDGTPGLGIYMQKMENPDLREKFALLKNETGVLVNTIYPDSPAKKILEPGDVIIKINGNNVANDGTIEFRKGERTFFGYLYQQKHINDFLNLEIKRNNKYKNIKIKLTKSMNCDRLVLHQQYDTPPVYYITGGLVFEPLTLNYLTEFGMNNNSWIMNAPTELLDFYFNGEPSEARKEIIILVKVLADEINVGYHDRMDNIIASVNGIMVSTIKDLVKAFEQNRNKYHVIEDIHGYKIILEKKKVKKFNNRILQRYKINADRSKDIPTPS
ncbi:MAG: trypsin-like peptidase domain-containing protein [Desulfosarcina sp.]|nr:trypsin-like peptidase domain-containing protein [Desulfobacterales bacterium]